MNIEPSVKLVTFSIIWNIAHSKPKCILCFEHSCLQLLLFGISQDFEMNILL